MVDLNEFERKYPKSEHPKGWEPSLQWDGTKGTITATLSSEPDDSVWAELIADWGLDPTRTQVVNGSLQIRAWDVSDGNGGSRRHKYYRATIAPREVQRDQADIEALCKLVEKRKPSKPAKTGGDSAFVVLLSDWQIGKGCEVRGGTPETVERIHRAIDESVARLKYLIKNYKVGAIYLIGLGDLVEGCSGDWYAMQTWSADLNDREQDKLVRRLILEVIDAFIDFELPIVCTGIPGNHGENRKNGKAFTDWLDNRDYAAFETVSEICAQNPDRYSNVKFPLEMCEDDLTVTFDIFGVPTAFAHGHQFRSGANAQAKMETWLKGQALGRTGVADAQILFAGHLHHFVISESTGRTVIQVPAMDGGSRWFQSTSGAGAPAGMVTTLIGSPFPRGWSELLIV